VRKDLKYKKDSSREREEEEKRELERDVWSLILEEEANMHERKDNMFTLNYSMRGDSEKVPPEPFIEMKGRNILFNNERANLILFHDVSAIVFKSNAECKYKEMLMVTITHELRTPVSGIMTVLHLLKDLTNSQGREYINIALSTAHLLLNLINDMMVLIYI
jgi:signal transduction histidine kinase